jgi:retron-type reverse transcriptase
MAVFELSLEDNLYVLHDQLLKGRWRADPYQRFRVCDPKPRMIHKASVRDRVLYQAVYRSLYKIFDLTFIHHSYASRQYKGTHKGVKETRRFVRKVSANATKQGFILKCDVRKFFDSVSHRVLILLLEKRILDPSLRSLLHEIIHSFEYLPGKGLPLGNVTSQLFANVYLNELDQFIKHTLREKFYIRYCDDFVIGGEDKIHLMSLIDPIRQFLYEKLQIELHPQKIFVQKMSAGIDFLGYVVFSHHVVLRTTTKRRMFKKLKEDAKPERVASYLGMLSHGNTFGLQQEIHDIIAANDS